MGTCSMPASAAYLSKAATPANNTSMPIFTGTLPSVNQRVMREVRTVAASGCTGAWGATGAMMLGRGSDAGNGGGAAGVGASAYAASRRDSVANGAMGFFVTGADTGACAAACRVSERSSSARTCTSSPRNFACRPQSTPSTAPVTMPKNTPPDPAPPIMPAMANTTSPTIPQTKGICSSCASRHPQRWAGIVWHERQAKTRNVRGKANAGAAWINA